jgi:hypothetical protein
VVNERYLRKISRLVLDWSVEAQLLIDARLRRWAKAVRRMRRHDAGLAARLEAELERARVDSEGRPEDFARMFRVIRDCEREANAEAAAILAKPRSCARLVAAWSESRL